MKMYAIIAPSPPSRRALPRRPAARATTKIICRTPSAIVPVDSTLAGRLRDSCTRSWIAYAPTIRDALSSPVPLARRIVAPTLHTNACTDAEAFVWEEMGVDDTTFVTFRGTESLWGIDGHYDLRAWPSRIANIAPYPKIHTGFWEQYASIQYAIFCDVSARALRQTKSGLRPKVQFAGHSLGGALAMLATMTIPQRLADTHIPEVLGVSCHVFGAPKVGDTSFAAYFDQQEHDWGALEFLRVTVGGDPVPMLPPTIRGLWRYTHPTRGWVGPLVIKDDAAHEDRRDYNNVINRMVRRHSMVSYSRALDEMVVA